MFCFFYFRKDNYLVAFKDVGTIRKLKIRLQENPNGSYFDGWTVAKVRFTETTVHLTNMTKLDKHARTKFHKVYSKRSLGNSWRVCLGIWPFRQAKSHFFIKRCDM